ncbi:hypothetical protein M0802_011789 [Mischocyttarus mexicanus]|nr:hypothetical protein M0802_011789 [Mischocyttarus mexicanus]
MRKHSIKNTKVLIRGQLWNVVVLFCLCITLPDCYDIEKVQHKFRRIAAKHSGYPILFNCHTSDSILNLML